jgi:formate hydrogenlyase subunit 4
LFIVICRLVCIINLNKAPVHQSERRVEILEGLTVEYGEGLVELCSGKPDGDSEAG